MRSIVIKLFLFLALTGSVFGQILQHQNGGTDISTPGPVSNVLCSTGTSWQSCTPGTPVNGATALFDDFCNNDGSSTLRWQINGGGGNTTTLVGGYIANHPCVYEVGATSQNEWVYLILGGNNSGGNYFQAGGYTADMKTSLNNNSGSTNTRGRFGLFDDKGVQDSNNGVFFEVDPAVNGNNNWWCVTVTGGVRTKADSGIAATAGVYNVLEFLFNSTSTPVWQINSGVVCGTLGPVNSTTTMAPAFEAVDLATTGSQTKLWIDYFSLAWSGLVR